jgi:uncharacterized protein YhaN
LTRLELKRFRCFREATVEFAPGLNVVRGPNESGKSTLRQALLAAFFGNPTSQSEAVERWTTWKQRERCELKLEYRDQNGVPCRLIKDFAKMKPELFVGGEKFISFKTLQNLVSKELGLESEEAYILCAALDVRSLANLGSAQRRKDVGKMLAGLMTGSADGQDALQVKKKLEDSLRELQKGLTSPAKTPGPLQAGRTQLDLWLAEAAKIRQGLQARQDRAQELVQLTAEQERLNARLLDLKNLLEANQLLREAKTRLEGLTRQDAKFEQDADRRRRLQAELEKLEAEIRAQPAAALSAQEFQELTALTGQIAALPVEPDSAPAGAANFPWLGLGLGVAACGLAIVLFAGWGWWVLALGTALALVGWTGQRRARQRAQTAQAQASNLGQQRRGLETRIQSLAQKAGGLEPGAIVKSWPQVHERAVQCDTRRQQMLETPAVDEEAWKTVRQELRLAKDQTENPRLAAMQLGAADLASRDREAQQLAANLEEIRRRRDRLQGQLENDQANADQLSSLEERIAEIKDRLAYLSGRERVLALTLEWLERAKSATLNPARQVLEERAGQLFAVFSQGRYQKISVDDDDLACRVWVPASGRWEDPSVLSQGAFDQFYFSLRLALSDLLAGGQKPPLLLDEPLAAFDAERAAAALGWLKAAARERQILLFTCRTDYDGAADKLIDLGRLTQSDEALETGRMNHA